MREQLADRTDYLAFPHRLDRPVSGVILVATRKRAARLLSDQFASRKVQKIYHAWVTGKVQPHQLGRWVDHVRKITGKPLTEIVESSSEGAQIAETQASLRAYDVSANRSLLELSPQTGRMHQLRIQTAHRGFPIIGDSQYGGNRLFAEPINLDGAPHPIRHHPPCELPEMASQSGSKAPPPSATPQFTASDREIPVSDGEILVSDRILLQAHQITFHNPSNGVLQTVTASDEPSESV